jgi:alkanesulfonate monooxygenase SsuD/methylene tetrahydromethanopterin reductase-like flavin-dependent oxidoreductase (luciferase family)
MLIDLLLVPFGTTYAEMRTAALVAEEAGFNGVWTWDHLRIPPPAGSGTVPEVLITLAALAEATQRLQLGTLVLNTGLRHPGLVANMAATLQQVSGGRFVLGLGAGGSDATPYVSEQAALGLPVEPDAVRRRRVAEAAQVLRLLWVGGAPSFDGANYQLNRAAGFLQPAPAPPIVIAGFGPRMARVAGRHGDGFNTQAAHPALSDLIDTARRERVASGRPLEQFEFSVFAGMSERWLNPNSRDRVRLASLGVGRLILLVEPPYPLTQIREAGRTAQIGV